jgi:hypothetical protein
VLVAPRAGPLLPPHLQSAEDGVDRSLYDNGVGDSRGYYHDGAYTAAPDPDLSTPSSPSEPGEYHHHTSSTNSDAAADPDVIARNAAALRKAYFDSLTAQFLTLRSLLHQTPPPELVASLPKEHGTYVGSFGAHSPTFRVWTRRIRHTDPLPAQVAALDRQSVLKLVRVILGGKFIRRGYELRERTSRWIWALLARLPDSGQMDYREVAWVRELGKRAVLMMMSIAQMAALREEVGDELDGGESLHDDGEDEEEEAQYIADLVVDDDDEESAGAEISKSGLTTVNNSEPQPPVVETPARLADPPASDQGDEVEMDMSTDDGEIHDEPAAAEGNQDMQVEIAAAKARLLARLDDPTDAEQDDSAAGVETNDTDRNGLENGDESAVFDETRARINMRATLNMILTVAGEFYGQRDLLEFRDPFPML